MKLPQKLYRALLDALDEAESLVGCKDPKTFEAWRQHYAALRLELKQYSPYKKEPK